MTETWDESIPAGSRNPVLGDDDVRSFKTAIRERLAKDHEFAASESPAFGASGSEIGMHKQLTLTQRTSGSEPSTAADQVSVFQKDDAGGDPEIFMRGESDGAITQVSDGGCTKILGSILSGFSVSAAQLNSDSVTTAKILNANVTLAKMAADSVDGTKIADDSIDSEHYVDGSIDLAHMGADSVDGTNIVDDAIDSEHYTNGSIDLAHLSADCVDGTKVADDAINSEHIAAGAVDLEHMSANSVDSDQYVNGSIDRVHLAADIVDGTKIANDAVNSEHIASGAVDLDHMSANSVDSNQYVDGSIDTVHLADNVVTPAKSSHGGVPVWMDGDGMTEITRTASTYGSVTTSKLKMPSGATALRLYARIKIDNAVSWYASARLYIDGSVSSGGDRQSTSYGWVDCGTVDVSGKTPGTVYDLSIQLKTTSSSLTAYIQGFAIWWE